MPIYGDYKYYLDPDGLNYVIKNIKPCYIRVKCDDDLAGKTVQLHFNNEVVTTRKVPSEAPFVVEFGVKELGTYTVVEADYDLSAEVVVNNYTMYETELYLGSITVTVEEEFIGQIISCSNGVTTKTWVADESKVHVFSVGLSTWTISSEVEGELYSEEVEVTEYVNYDVSLATLESYTKWLSLGRVTKSFSSLDDVLADQTTLRQLMTIHASADYLIKSVRKAGTNFRNKILASDNALKWIGLRDYTYDKIPSDFLAEWLAGPYWKRALKDHVPIMTSNTTPYGTASASGYHSEQFAPYCAFGDDISRAWYCVTGLNSWVQYKFTNPTKINKFKIYGDPGGRDKEIVISASNDGSTYKNLANIKPTKNQVKYFDINNDDYYLYYRITVIATDSSLGETTILGAQFYGRSLNVSVPAMTSNTAPYGKVSASSVSTAASNVKSYAPFSDGSMDIYWYATTKTDQWVEYDFGKPIVVKSVDIHPGYANSTSKFCRVKNFVIRGSNNGSNWTDIYTGIWDDINLVSKIYSFSNENAYSKYRIFVKDTIDDNIGLRFGNNFYGVDYSEREFEQGSTVKYLFDHGVELEPFTSNGYIDSNEHANYNKPIVFEDEGIILENTANYETYGLYSLGGTDNKIDISPYKTVRANVDILSPVMANGMIAVISTKNYLAASSNKAYADVKNGTNDVSFSINNLSGSMYVVARLFGWDSVGNTLKKYKIKELWLE